MAEYTVYVQTDDRSRVTGIISSEFLPDTTGWTPIDQGEGDRYHHAQGHYLPKPLTDERGIYRYMKDGTYIVERRQEDMDADAAQITTQPTKEERLAALEAQNQMLVTCLLEMSQQVYA